MKARMLLMGAVVAVLSVLVLAGPAWAQDSEKKKDKDSEKVGAYKIGVVDRKVVLDGYKKMKKEYEALEEEVKERQKPITALSDKINADKAKYAANEASMTPTEKDKLGAEIQADFREYELMLKTEQGHVDDQERRLMKRAFTEIDEAVAKIGARDGYYLILDGNTRSGAIYYAPALDMSQKVVDELNGKS